MHSLYRLPNTYNLTFLAQTVSAAIRPVCQSTRLSFADASPLLQQQSLIATLRARLYKVCIPS